MKLIFLFYICYLTRFAKSNRLLDVSTVDEYMNLCLDGINHKQAPGPESSLFAKCAPWKDRSCCTQTITESLHINRTWYKIDLNHCNRNISPKCRERFNMDNCFYECSPNVGPWLVKQDGLRIRNERFLNVPLCRHECDAWWEDCKDDFTCIDNWSRGFDWSSGYATCPADKSCITFQQMFRSSRNFCEKVWDHSWKVVDDNNPNGCFVMSWENNAENPNRKVAENRAQQIISSSGTSGHVVG